MSVVSSNLERLGTLFCKILYHFRKTAWLLTALFDTYHTKRTWKEGIQGNNRGRDKRGRCFAVLSRKKYGHGF